MTDDKDNKQDFDTGAEHSSGPVSSSSMALTVWQTGVRCRCPVCGKGKLYEGVLKLRDSCPSCRVDFSEADTGDGPAVFVIFILGLLVSVLAAIIEVKIAPPTWFHLIFWPTFVFGMSIYLLRMFKAILVALHFKLDVHQAILDDRDTTR